MNKARTREATEYMHSYACAEAVLCPTAQDGWATDTAHVSQSRARMHTHTHTHTRAHTRKNAVHVRAPSGSGECGSPAAQACLNSGLPQVSCRPAPLARTDGTHHLCPGTPCSARGRQAGRSQSWAQGFNKAQVGRAHCAQALLGLRREV